MNQEQAEALTSFIQTTGATVIGIHPSHPFFTIKDFDHDHFTFDQVFSMLEEIDGFVPTTFDNSTIQVCNIYSNH